jgi:hypothetical protein
MQEQSSLHACIYRSTHDGWGEGADGDGELSSEQAAVLRKKGASTEGYAATAATMTECYF